MSACNIGGADVLVCHVHGQYFAVSNRCSHSGQALAGGQLHGYELRCPRHRACFDVRTGAAIGPPASAPIASYPVTLAGGKVNVSLMM